MRQHGLDCLRAGRAMTVATTGPESPAARAVFRAREGLDSCFPSAPDARHGPHRRIDPRAAITLQEDHADWRTIQGVQRIAEGREVAGEAAAAARARRRARARADLVEVERARASRR